GDACFFPRGALLKGGRMAAPVALRGRDAAARLDLDADVEHRQFGACDRPQEHELVEVPQVTDAEQLACDLREARAEREVVALESVRNDLSPIGAFWHHDRGHGIR